jgi:glycosyltransferase involved in cell wall biosynthesis
MARLLVRALRGAGHEVELASRLRAYAMEESAAAQEEIATAGAREAARLVQCWTDAPARRPDLWFTYHLYYRAPDWIGPVVARELAVPYVVAEASFAMKRACGVWSIGHEATERALQCAAIVFSLAAGDRAGLSKVAGFSARMIDLPAFIDAGPKPPPQRPRAVTRLLAVAMMRARAKIESYRILGRSLARLTGLAWHLDVAGDGPERPEVEAALAPLGRDRVTYLGALDEPALARAYANCDLLVWPGFEEAYGMVYLEAQAAGLPVVAMDHRGVANVVRDGVSGRLTAAGDDDAYVAALGELIANRQARERLGRSAHAFIKRERSLAGAALILGRALGAAARAA